MVCRQSPLPSRLPTLLHTGEALIGKRAYRVVFALVSLPLAAVTVGYFINHRYQGTQLWMVQDIPGIRPLVWILSLISFFFLYPSTFNLLEVVDSLFHNRRLVKALLA